MPTKKFDLLAVDLDSTLIDWTSGDAKMTTECINALLQANEVGMVIVVATGRSLRETRLELKAQWLDWDGLIPKFIIAQEKYCYRILDGKAVEDEALSNWNCERIIEAKKAMECFVLPNASQWLKSLSEAGLVPKRWVIDTGAGWLSLFFNNVAEAEKAEEIMKRLIADIPELITNRNAHIVGFVPQNGTKGKALRFLADMLGIPTSRVIAIGDNINDWDMLNGEHGFFPVAVANADLKLKSTVQRLGGLVTEQVSSNGVAEAIKWALQD